MKDDKEFVEVIRKVRESPPDDLADVVEDIRADDSWTVGQALGIADVLDRQLLPWAQQFLAQGQGQSAVAVAREIVHVLTALREQLPPEDAWIVDMLLKPREKLATAFAQAEQTNPDSLESSPAIGPGAASPATAVTASSVFRLEQQDRSIGYRETRTLAAGDWGKTVASDRGVDLSVEREMGRNL